jgi:hypothetical protein
MTRKLILLAATILLSACAGPQITRVQALSATADAPYKNVLVVSLFELFDTRRWLEDAIVKELAAKGITAIASTSLMNTKTPVTRQTFQDMVDEHGSDSVLITQLVNLDSVAKEQDSRPESTYIVRPTYYYNMWSVELTEYVEPQFLTLEHDFRLATEVYSVSAEESVWAIESRTKLVTQRETRGDTSFITDEAKAIVRHMASDGLIAK